MIETVKTTGILYKYYKPEPNLTFKFPFTSKQDYLTFRTEWRARYKELSALIRAARCGPTTRCRWEHGQWHQEEFLQDTRVWAAITEKTTQELEELARKRSEYCSSDCVTMDIAALSHKANVMMQMRTASKKWAHQCWIQDQAIKKAA